MSLPCLPDTNRGRRPASFLLAGVAALVCAGTAAESSAEADWVEVASHAPDDPREGYRVFEREVPGSSYKAYRIEALIEGPPERAVRAARLRILDTRYVGEGRERRVIGRDGDAMLLYFRIAAPMIDDRDGVTRMEPARPQDGSLGFRWRSTEGGPQPPEGVVRMPNSEGSWSFRPAAAGRSHAVYESFSELGGSIPSWIVNRMMVGEQLKEIATLRAVLAEHDDPELHAALARVDQGLPAVGAAAGH